MFSKENSYRKLPLDDNSNGSETEEGEILVTDNRSWVRRKANYVAFHTTLLCLYAIVTLTIVTQFARKAPAGDQCQTALTYSIATYTRERGAQIILTRNCIGPASEAIRDTTYVFNAAPNLTSPYVGESRPSLDKAWHDLLRSRYSAVHSRLSPKLIAALRHQHEDIRR